MNINRRNFTLGLAGLPAAAAFGQSSSSASIGVLIPGSVADRGFNESAFNGFKAMEAKSKGSLRYQLIENINAADAEQAMMQLAAKHDLIAAVSGASQRPLLTVAKRFPNKRFLLIAGTKLTAGETNVSQFDVRQAENGFLAGAAAALLSKTGTMSIIGGVELPGLVNTSKEFTNGVRHVRPGGKVLVTFTGSWDDVSKAKEATLAAVANAADVHFPVQRNGLLGVEQASRDSGTKLFGVWTARCGADPSYAAYSVIGIGHLLAHGIQQFLDGKFVAGSQAFGFKAGPEASDIVVCSGMTPQLAARLEEIKRDIVAGKIQTLEG